MFWVEVIVLQLQGLTRPCLTAHRHSATLSLSSSANDWEEILPPRPASESWPLSP
jgi:hypothetical protein